MHALPYTLAVFALILVLARFKIPLTIAILIGSIVIGVLFKLPVVELAATLGAGAIQPRTIALAVITALLLALSGLMQTTKQFEEIVTLARQLLRRPALTMAALPALVGLLPMPGGALFSAPMVESAAGKNHVSPAHLSAINYWFRHLWEHWWPLYPGVMLAITLTGTDFARFAMYQLPLGISMLLAGLLLFRKTHPELHTKSQPPQSGTKRKFLRASSSIWVILLIWFPSKFLLSLLLTPRLPESLQGTFDKFLPLTLGLLGSMLWTIYFKNCTRTQLKELFSRKSIYIMVSLVIAVMVFQHTLAHVKAATQIADELLRFNIPVVLVVAVLPFIAGLVTGLAIGFVGTSVPIVIALVAALPDNPAPPALPAYIALAYGFGHLGQMMSPLHLCHVVSNQYFKTTFSPVYRLIVPSAIFCALLVTIYHIFLRTVL
jgi:integral membrane protein (TIGR00529 family)